MKTRGKRHPLLVYRRQFQSWRGATFLVFVLSAALAFFRPPPLDTFLLWLAFSILATVSGALLIYTFVAPQVSYVQCYPNYLRISTPMYNLAISYARIRTLRPYQVVAPPKGPLRYALEPYLGQTAVGLDLISYPQRERTMRLFLHPTLFAADFKGFVLITPDWMGLSTEIDSFRSNAKSGRKTAVPVSAASSLLNRRR